MSAQPTREQRRALERENAKWPLQPIQVSRADWPEALLKSQSLVAVWRGRRHLVQVHKAAAPAVARLSINSTTHDGDRWSEGLSWEELQDLKNIVGYPLHTAVEIFPPANEVVNVANMRHLWVLAERFPFQWR